MSCYISIHDDLARGDVCSLPQGPEFLLCDFMHLFCFVGNTACHGRKRETWVTYFSVGTVCLMPDQANPNQTKPRLKETATAERKRKKNGSNLGQAFGWAEWVGEQERKRERGRNEQRRKREKDGKLGRERTRE